MISDNSVSKSTSRATEYIHQKSDLADVVFIQMQQYYVDLVALSKVSGMNADGAKMINILYLLSRGLSIENDPLSLELQVKVYLSE